MIIYAGVIYTGCALYGMGYIIKEKKVLLFRKDLQMTELKEDEKENRSKFMIFLDFAVLGLIIFFSVGAIYKTIPREYEMHNITYKLPRKYKYDIFQENTDTFDLGDIAVIWVEYRKDYAKAAAHNQRLHDRNVF